MTLIYGTVYLAFMFIYYGASSEWVYYVLDWDQPSALGLYVFLPLALFVAFLVWCGCRPCSCTMCCDLQRGALGPGHMPACLVSADQTPVVGDPTPALAGCSLVNIRGLQPGHDRTGKADADYL